MTPCSLVQVHGPLVGTYCLHIQGRWLNHARGLRSKLLVAWLTRRPWKWRQYIPPKVSKFLPHYATSPNVLDLYWKGACFESGSWHRLYGLRFFVDFFSPSRIVRG
jgi:hypothetical protein